ncbi:MAG: uroporphyrinogen-III C-methyltransferase [Gammaproteobacteria bacterium]
MSQHDKSEDDNGQPVEDDADDAAEDAGTGSDDADDAAEDAGTESDDTDDTAEDASAESEDTEVASSEAPEPPAEDEQAQDVRPERRRKGPYVAVVLAFTIALFAAGAAGFLLWQYRQFELVLDQVYSDTTASLQAVLNNVRLVEDRMTDLAAANEATRGLTTDLGGRVDALPGRLLDLEQRLNATLGISEDARRRWLRTEVEYYLTVANVELTLAGRWDNATNALMFADEKLVDLANPALSGVRERIAAELRALRDVRLPDIEGLSYTLGGLTESGRTLPLLSTVPENYTAERDAPEETVSGLTRAWLSLKNAVMGMVSIERRDDSITRSLSTEEQALVRQQLELELVLARLSLVSGQSEVFRQSVLAAEELLVRHFDMEEVAVESAIALLNELAELDIDPERPDISGSLSLLRSLVARGG